MTPQELVCLYEKGAITAHHLVLECLNRLDPKSPSAALKDLPHDVLVCMLAFTKSYIPGRMQSNYGAPPAVDQVLAAKDWIEANGVANSVSGPVAKTAI
jgi:hypothetical protein